jgi:hypothetical protein
MTASIPAAVQSDWSGIRRHDGLHRELPFGSEGGSRSCFFEWWHAAPPRGSRPQVSSCRAAGVSFDLCPLHRAGQATTVNALTEIQRATARRVDERHALRFVPKILDTALVVSLFCSRDHRLRVT